MATESVNQIVAEALPGLEIVDQAPEAASDQVRASIKPGPSIAELRNKYLGYAADSNLKAVGPALEPAETVVVKQVRPRVGAADLNKANRATRTLIISETKGLIGSQG